MNIEMSYRHDSALGRWWKSRNFLQKRMARLCLSLLVMLLCFPLYYLGFFGTVDGPLNPAHIGNRLAHMGVSRTHAMVLFLTFMIIAVSWNWIYNLASLMAGSRLACSRTGAHGKSCAARVARTKEYDRKSGKNAVWYVCEKGHRRAEAHFFPVKKGTLSHSLWLISVAFCLIVFFMS